MPFPLRSDGCFLIGPFDIVQAPVVFHEFYLGLVIDVYIGITVDELHQALAFFEITTKPAKDLGHLDAIGRDGISFGIVQKEPGLLFELGIDLTGSIGFRPEYRTREGSTIDCKVNPWLFKFFSQNFML